MRNCGLEIAKVKIRDADLPEVAIRCLKALREPDETRVQVFAKEELKNGVVHKTHRLLLFIHLDEIRAPRGEPVDAVHQTLWERVGLADPDTHSLA